MAGKLRPSPSASATAFSPGTVKKGNDGNKYIIVVASNGVPRWQKSKPSFATKMAMKKPGVVKKSVLKKPAVATRVGPSLPEKKSEKPKSVAQLAVDVCRRLTKGQLRISDLGKTSDTKGYVLMRDFAKKYLSKAANYKQFQKTFCDDGDPSFVYPFNSPMDPVLTTISYFPAAVIEDRSVDAMKILFSDEKDKVFFSLGVVGGHYVGDSANQFYYEFLFKKKYNASQIKAQLSGKKYKIIENLMVKHNGIHELTHASHVMRQSQKERLLGLYVASQTAPVQCLWMQHRALTTLDLFHF